MSWTDVRNGMASLLHSVTGLTDRAVSPSNTADTDVAVVLPGTPLIEPFTHDGTYAVNVRVVVQVYRGTAEDMQRRLDEYVWPSGTKSVPAAIMVDPTLGGAVEATEFRGVTGYGLSQDEPARMQADVNFRCLLEG